MHLVETQLATLTPLVPDVAQIKTDVEGIKLSLEEFVGLFSTSNKVLAFAKKHGPRAVAFMTGVLGAAGVGNPAVWHFIAAFFK